MNAPARLHFDFVLTDEALQRLQREEAEAAGAGVGGGDPLRALQLAWHLRQRDTAAAVVRATQAHAWLADAQLEPEARARLQARIELVLGESRWLAGDLHAAAGHARQALQAPVDDPLLQADAQWLLSCVETERGDAAARDAALQRCAEAARAGGDAMREVIAQGATARWAVLRDAQEAQARWQPHFEAHPLVNAPGVATWVHDFHRGLAFGIADFGAAARHCLQMQADAQATGQLQRALIAQTNLGACHGNLHDYETALDWTQRALDAARAKGWPVSVANCLLQTGAILRLLGRLEDAHAVLTEGIASAGLPPRSRNRGLLLQYLGEVQQERQQHEAALDSFRELEALSDSLGDSELRNVAHLGQASALESLGHPREALHTARQCLTLAESQGNPYEQIEVLSLLARIAEHHGDALREDLAGEDALQYLDRAIRLGSTIAGFTVPVRLFEAQGREYARRGDYPRAYASALAAAEARERSNTSAAIGRAAAIQAAHQAELALADTRHQLALAEAEAQRARDLQTMTETLQRLGDIGRDITAHLEEHSVIGALDAHVDGLLDAVHFSVWLLEDDGLSLSCAFGREAELRLPPLRVSLDDPGSNVARCARERREIAKDRPTPGPNPAHIPGTFTTASALFAPLTIGQRLLGVMTIQSPRPQAYGERERLVFRTLCAYGAIGLSNAKTTAQLQEKHRLLEQAHREQRDASLTDPLTGLHNRRFLLQQIEEESALSVRRTRQQAQAAGALDVDVDMSFFLVDIDHFKQVNDRYGHAAGDAVLAQVSACLRRIARESDFVVRWGGEEFLLVARATDRRRAGNLAERLRAEIEQCVFRLDDGRTLQLTCSIGSASYPFLPEDPEALDWSQVVELADQALYRAKRHGRNRWVAYVGTARTAPAGLYRHLVNEPERAIREGLLVLQSGAGRSIEAPSVPDPT